MSKASKAVAIVAFLVLYALATWLLFEMLGVE